ncbi:UDP-N-acetylmuramoyl-L-alanine--D-glutamate ligase [Xylocopilactobacillus apicola]|uniref:UDP-N-acetylmuramoylalanine--D-glutamate ligase n=1 Tax=Xylocopilactobacillus apicola TaxID=2932184 RepID=A0AAU9CWG5_9LACO|nr:UDP-N-acetylmuramoyl-L-alanine--D-glutamate ligase [Xylocopilactobacillus apicola]BDR58304.1 UDP-N-acetylmuramoylalanine--D-glutamate ligase [Xylocopilactobacillus apicola]
MKNISSFRNKKILVLGLGLSGLAAIDLLKHAGAEIFYHDDQSNSQASGTMINCQSAEELAKLHLDVLIKSPGIPLENWYVETAQKLQIPIMTELELAARFCDSHLVAVTGTNGKTTVTTLIYEMIKLAQGGHAFKAGNIGIPFSKVVQEAKSDDYIVVEASSFQLEFTQEFHPQIAVITNVFPHHLEHHHSFENYLAAKSFIFANQIKSDFLVVNGDHQDLNPYLKEAKSQLIFFSAQTNPQKAVVYVSDRAIYYKDEKICKIEDLLIRGQHNLENFIAAATVAKLLGIENQVIKKVAQTFKGVEHRLEYVGEKFSCKFYNDSKATDEEATIVALDSLNAPIVLLAGGMDRGDNFSALAQHLKNVKLVELFGENREILQKIIASSNIKIVMNNTLQEAFNDGVTHLEAGDTMLLSPASASWDQFKSFEERGKMFKKMYRELEK